MSNYLLDTNIISRLAPGEVPLSPAMRTWFHEKGEADALFLSAITIAEIEKGLRSLNRRGGVERAARLAAWLDAIVESFGDRILPIDTVVGRVVGVLEDEAIAGGHNPGLADLIIAATACSFGLTLITENLRHFKPLGISVDLPTAFRPD